MGYIATVLTVWDLACMGMKGDGWILMVSPGIGIGSGSKGSMPANACHDR